MLIPSLQPDAFEFYRGSHVVVPFVAPAEAGDLTGAAITFFGATQTGSAPFLALSTADGHVVVTDGPNRKFTVTFDSATTASVSLSAGHYVGEAWRTDAGQERLLGYVYFTVRDSAFALATPPLPPVVVPLPITQGGTGQTTAAAALTALLPDQTGHAGQVLGTDGTAAAWIAVGSGSGTVTSVGLTMPALFGVTGSPITTAGTLTVTLANQNANLVLAGPVSGPAAVPTFRTLTGADVPLLTGAVLWVDAVNGNNATAVRGDANRPFAGPEAARNAAQSGDLIYVRPGNYAITSALSRDLGFGVPGANWWFEPGATVTLTASEPTVPAIWQGIRGPYKVRGHGTFTYNVTSHAVSATQIAAVKTSNADHNVDIECADLVVNDPFNTAGAAGTKGIWCAGGNLRVRLSRDLTVTGVAGNGGSDTTGWGIWWDNGECNIEGRTLTSSADNIYGNVTTPPTGDLRVHFLNVAYGGGKRPAVYDASTDGTAALWVRSDTIHHDIMSNGAGRVYVECQKVFGSIITGASTGLVYVRSDKVTGNVVIQGGQAWVQVNDFDVSDNPSNCLVVNGGTLDLVGGVFRTAAAVNGAVCFGGTCRFHGTRIDTSARATGTPLTLTGGTVEVGAGGLHLVAATGRDAVTASTPQTLTLAGPLTFNTTINANVTVASQKFAAPTFAGTVTATAFAGDGSALTNLAPANMAVGVFPASEVMTSPLIVRAVGGVAGQDEVQITHNGTDCILQTKKNTSGFRFRRSDGNDSLTLDTSGTGTFSNNLGCSGALFSNGGQVQLTSGFYLVRAASRVGRLTDSGNNPATLCSPANTPAALSANTNDWSPGPGWFNRISASSAVNLTGMVAGQDGEVRFLWNVGANTITLVHQSASSSAANRWLSTTGADLALAANKIALATYDTTSACWRVTLLP